MKTKGSHSLGRDTWHARHLQGHASCGRSCNGERTIICFCHQSLGVGFSLALVNALFAVKKRICNWAPHASSMSTGNKTKSHNFATPLLCMLPWYIKKTCRYGHLCLLDYARHSVQPWMRFIQFEKTRRGIISPLRRCHGKTWHRFASYGSVISVYCRAVGTRPRQIEALQPLDGIQSTRNRPSPTIQNDFWLCNTSIWTCCTSLKIL